MSSTRTRNNGCYYGEASCHGDLWQCLTCKAMYCENHNHVTRKGSNVECVACERERLDAELLQNEDNIEQRIPRADLLDRLDIPDK